MMIDRTIAIGLIVVLAFFMVVIPEFYFPVSFAVYALIIFGFFHAAFIPKKE